MITKIKRKLNTLGELIVFKIKKLSISRSKKEDIYKKSFLDNIKNEIEKRK